MTASTHVQAASYVFQDRSGVGCRVIDGLKQMSDRAIIGDDCQGVQPMMSPERKRQKPRAFTV
ncbi:MAG: hypothetical protein WA790_17025 [Sulfitobacter sp.]